MAFIKKEMLELIIYPFVLVIMIGCMIVFYILLFYFLITCFIMSALLLLWEKFYPTIDKIMRKFFMPDFVGYDLIRSHAKRILRNKLFKEAEEKIRKKYPLLNESSDQYRRAIKKLLKY